MARHFSAVLVEGDGEQVTITIDCRQCGRSTFTLATAHLQTLARVLPDVCAQAGIALDPAQTETYVTSGDSEDEIRAALDSFVLKRTRQTES